MAKDITPRTFVKSKDYNGPGDRYNGLGDRFYSNMSNQYKDTRVSTWRPSGFKQAQTFHSTQNTTQKTK
jgi:hypothetical protein